MRGGVSGTFPVLSPATQSSPRAWGCFQNPDPDEGRERVFPTCVGVFLSYWTECCMAGCLPHVRGGVSADAIRQAFRDWSSPRAWGCFSACADSMAGIRVFPTCVGVFPWCDSRYPFLFRLPHVRGGVSVHHIRAGVVLMSSPRAWGCF